MIEIQPPDLVTCFILSQLVYVSHLLHDCLTPSSYSIISPVYHIQAYELHDPCLSFRCCNVLEIWGVACQVSQVCLAQCACEEWWLAYVGMVYSLPIIFSCHYQSLQFNTQRFWEYMYHYTPTYLQYVFFWCIFYLTKTY